MANVARAQPNNDDEEFDEDLIHHFGDAKAALATGSPGRPDSLSRHHSASASAPADFKQRPAPGRTRGHESTGSERDASGREESGEPFRKRVKEDSPDRASEGGERDDEAVEASVNLEFLALGRPRAFADSHDRADSVQSVQAAQSAVSPLASIMTPPSAGPSPVSIYPDGASLLAVAPNVLEERIILDHGLDSFGWHVRHSHPHPDCRHKRTDLTGLFQLVSIPSYTAPRSRLSWQRRGAWATAGSTCARRPGLDSTSPFSPCRPSCSLMWSALRSAGPR